MLLCFFTSSEQSLLLSIMLGNIRSQHVAWLTQRWSTQDIVDKLLADQSTHGLVDTEVAKRSSTVPWNLSIDSSFKFLQIMFFGAKSREWPFEEAQDLGFRVPRSRFLESMWIQSCIDSLFKFLQIMFLGAKSREWPFEGHQGLGFRVPRSRVLESMWVQICIDSLFKFLQIMFFGTK